MERLRLERDRRAAGSDAFSVSNRNRSPPCWLIRAKPSQLAGAGRVGAVAARGEARAVGGVVGGLADDDRVLAGLEDAAAVSVDA